VGPEEKKSSAAGGRRGVPGEVGQPREHSFHCSREKKLLFGAWIRDAPGYALRNLSKSIRRPKGELIGKKKSQISLTKKNGGLWIVWKG